MGFCSYNISSTYTWNTGETTSEILVSNSGKYWVEVTNQYGCLNSDTVIVNFKFDDSKYIIPNVVTPNGDEVNDTIDFGKYEPSIINLEVKNRWGVKVFGCNELPCIWNPKENDGTYYYIAQYKTICDDIIIIKNLKGFITLIK